MYIKSLITLGVAAALASCGNDVPIPSGPNDTDQGVVTVAGSPAIGETLTASVVDADGVDSSTLVYQWSADGEVLEGETASTLLITDALFGQEITVFVQYADDDGVIGGATSESTASVSTVNIPGTVTVTGTAQVGETLTATIEDGNGVPAAVTSYQWAAAGEDIDGATAATYELQFSELDAIITINVVYTDNQNFDEDLTSTATAAVIARENTEGTVTIAGSASVGSVLTATVADVNGITTSTIAYQWLADNTAIAGATDQTFSPTATQVDTVISVTAAYTDDEGNAEDLGPAAPTDVVTTTAVDLPGSVAISGDLLSGETLTATITDANGVDTANATFQWQADGADILDATTETLALSADQLGTEISVNVTYTDNDGFADGGSATATSLVYSVVVNGEAALVNALAAAAEGDWIALGSAEGDAGVNDYADMATITLSLNNLTLTRATGSDAVITGETCIIVDSDTSGLVIDGLVFDELSVSQETQVDCLNSSLNNGASLLFDGSGNILRNTEFLSDVEVRPTGWANNEDYHYMTLSGTDNVIERNLFAGKWTNEELHEGSAISIFINDDEGEDERNIVQFNLFRDFQGELGEGDSNSVAIQLGRTGGNDSRGDGDHDIRYNRFDNVITDRRLIRVQGGGNRITANTVVNSLGMIALEDGFGNTVSRNIIISNAANGDDGGIGVTPLGHTVTDNFISNLRTGSADRAGIQIDYDALDNDSSNSGNTALLAELADFDVTTVIARNTIFNARQAILFENQSRPETNSPIFNCQNFDAILDFDDNLIANSSGSVGASRAAVTDADWNSRGCVISPESDFDNNHFYSSSLIEDGGVFDFGGAAGIDGNISGAEDGAAITAPDANGLIEGTGIDADIGVDIDALDFITEDLVGPGSTWVPGE